MKLSPAPSWQLDLSRLETHGFALVETVERGPDLPEKGVAVACVYASPNHLEAAHLMVAAPDLLDALEAIASAIDRGMAGIYGIPGLKSQIDAALTKARGELEPGRS